MGTKERTKDFLEEAMLKLKLEESIGISQRG